MVQELLQKGKSPNLNTLQGSNVLLALDTECFVYKQ